MLNAILTFFGFGSKTKPISHLSHHGDPVERRPPLPPDWPPPEAWQDLWIAYVGDRAIAWGLGYERALERAHEWLDDQVDHAMVRTYHLQCRRGEVLHIIALMGLGPKPPQPQDAVLQAAA